MRDVPLGFPTSVYDVCSKPSRTNYTSPILLNVICMGRTPNHIYRTPKSSHFFPSITYTSLMNYGSIAPAHCLVSLQLMKTQSFKITFENRKRSLLERDRGCRAAPEPGVLFFESSGQRVPCARKRCRDHKTSCAPVRVRSNVLHSSWWPSRRVEHNS
jgi:hypothetical protein